MLTIKRLGLEDTRIVIAGARSKAEEIGVAMCIAITDESGQLIAFERLREDQQHHHSAGQG